MSTLTSPEFIVIALLIATVTVIALIYLVN
jgi:hypothetical protein